MNPIDAIVGYFNPRAGAQRVAARRLFTSLSRDYDAASRSERARSLRGRGTSANTETGAALGTLRDRARDIARNTWIGASILDKLPGLAVGTGIQVRFATGNKTLDKRAAKLWKEWVRQADVEGVLDLNGLLSLAVRSTIESGEVVMRRVPVRAADKRKVKLALQLLEADHIDGSANLTQQETTRLGVEIGDWGERKGLWLFPVHPGEMSVKTSLRSTLVAMDDLVHLYRPLRPGQVRGVSWFAPMMMTARDYADLMDALVVKAKIEACFGAFITSEGEGAASDLAPVKDDLGLALKPALLTRLKPGEQVSFANPTSSNGHNETGLRALMGMAASVGLTYDQVTGDLRQANYSSLRAGKIEQRRLTEQFQWHCLAPMALEKIVGWFLSAAILGGQLPQRVDGYPHEYVMPAVEPIDPQKDLQADIDAVRSGRMSPQEFIEMWGRDWREVVEEFGAFYAATDALGLVFDIDGRRSKSGATTTPGSATDPAAAGGQGTSDPATPDPAQADPATV